MNREYSPTGALLIMSSINNGEVFGEGLATIARALQQMLQTEFTATEQKVLELRFGLDDKGVRTLEQVGETVGVTRERIRQIEAKALRKLRHPSRSFPLNGLLRDLVLSLVGMELARARQSILILEGKLRQEDQEKKMLACELENRSVLEAKYGTKLATNIDELVLSTRTRNALHAAGKHTVADLFNEQLLLGYVPNFGKVAAKEVRIALNTIGIEVEVK